MRIPTDGAGPAPTAGAAGRLGRARRRAGQTNSALQPRRLETQRTGRCPWRIFDDASAVAAMTKAMAVHVGSAAETDCSYCSYSRDSNQSWRRCRQVPLRVVTVAGRTSVEAIVRPEDCPALATMTPCANYGSVVVRGAFR